MRNLCSMISLAAIATGLATTVLPEPARADTLLVERVARQSGSALPTRGQSMASVRERFGAPDQEMPAVGGDRPRHPPITRWVYPEFTVHFERERVIHAVVRRSSAVEQGPKPVE